MTLAIRTAALFVAVLALADHSRLTVLALIAVALTVWRLSWLPELAGGRKLWRNSSDPEFQGDGWRWTLCLLLPNLLLYRTTGRHNPMIPIGAPFTLDMLALTRDQRMACYAEWYATQRDYERLGRPLERWETIEREEQ